MSFLDKDSFKSLNVQGRKREHRPGVKKLRSLSSLLRPKRQRRIPNGKFQVIDNLSVSSFGKEELNKRRKRKAKVFIASLNDLPNDERSSMENDVLIQKDEVDEILGGFDMKNVKKNVGQLVRSMDKIKKQNDEQIKKSERSIIEVDDKSRDDQSKDDVESKIRKMKESVDVVSKANMYDNTRRSKEVKLKYEEERPDFHPKVLGIAELKSRTSKYISLLESILAGQRQSYFYDIARGISLRSRHPFITDLELINISKSRFHGYYGAIRAHVISSYIIDKLGPLLKEKVQRNKVMKFWRTDYFALYVLASEIIVRFVEDDMQFDTLDEAYVEMENTNDYGLYVMDKIPLED